MGSVNRENATPVGTMGSVNRDSATPIGTMGSVRQGSISPVGTMGSVNRENATPVGTMGSVRQEYIAPVGTMGRMNRENATPVATMGRMNRDMPAIAFNNEIRESASSMTGILGAMYHEEAMPPDTMYDDETMSNEVVDMPTTTFNCRTLVPSIQSGGMFVECIHRYVLILLHIRWSLVSVAARACYAHGPCVRPCSISSPSMCPLVFTLAIIHVSVHFDHHAYVRSFLLCSWSLRPFALTLPTRTHVGDYPFSRW